MWWARRLEAAVTDDRYEVTVGAGSLRDPEPGTTRFAHRWTAAGVTAGTAFTGAHLMHLAIAGCVLNDVYREAEALGVELDGVRVVARGGFDPATWESTGIEYTVDVRSDASPDTLAHLLAVVDAVAEIPRALRAGAPVRRV
jgi:uncharacterized OsmC-like protein